MRKSGIGACIFLLSAFFILGCSSGGGSPTLPDAENTNPRNPSNVQTLMGLYTIILYTQPLSAEVVPVRNADFQVNVVRFLQPPVGDPADLRVRFNPDGTDVANGIFDLDVSITHPFPGTNLRGFDVRGIVFGEKGSLTSSMDNTAQYPSTEDLRVLNADGYTRWWNAVEFLTPGLLGYTPTMLGNTDPKATVNGYRYFCDGLGRDDPMDIDVETRGTFSTQDPSGESNTLTRRYVLKFPVTGGVPEVKFSYAILASFAAPEPGSLPPAPVDAYPIEANCPEAYQLSLSVAPSSTAWYLSTGGGGDLELRIEVYDWQALENPHGVPAEVGEIGLECAGMWEGVKEVSDLTASISDGGPTSSVWIVEIPDVAPDARIQEIFMTVQSEDPETYAPPIPGSAIYPGGKTLAAYLITSISLPGNSPPIIGEISGTDVYVDGAVLSYTLSDMYDLQDGPNLKVRWDSDGDEDFDDDEDGSDTDMTATFTFTGEDPYPVKCRVYDTQGLFAESNTIVVHTAELPFIDPMDTSTVHVWKVQNGIFGTHLPGLEWNLQEDHWGVCDPNTGSYLDYMDTTLISPQIPAGDEDTVTFRITHRYYTETGYDTCRLVARVNRGDWQAVSGYLDGFSPGWPEYIVQEWELSGLSPGDVFDFGFAFSSDSMFSYYFGWDIDHVIVMDNKPPVIEGIYGPSSVEDNGPWTYSTVATDLQGIDTYMWSVEQEGFAPVYDDPGDGEGNIEITFPADGDFDIWVKVTDLGEPPLSTEFGPYRVLVFTSIEDAFFRDHFIQDTGNWTYTGGIDDGSHQDFWHMEPPNSFLSNVGPNGCYAESDMKPIEKTASANVVFPLGGGEGRMKILHRLDVESGGLIGPHDGQWMTIDDIVVSPEYGFLYFDSEGEWDHGYFVGETDGWVISTFFLGTDFNDGEMHTVTFHSLSDDTFSNCSGGWQIDFIEMWLED